MRRRRKRAASRRASALLYRAGKNAKSSFSTNFARRLYPAMNQHVRGNSPLAFKELGV
jgi:hypothetical protein